MNLNSLTNKWSLLRYRVLYDVFQTIQRAVCYQHPIKWLSKEKNCTILDLLQEKLPCCQTADLKYVVSVQKNWHLPFHLSLFENINGSEIKRAAMKTNGSHGPSGLDAGKQRQLLRSYKSSSNDLSKTVIKLAIRIATGELIFLDS